MTNEKDKALIEAAITKHWTNLERQRHSVNQQLLSDLLIVCATVRAEVFKEMIGMIASLPTQGTMNYRRGYEEGVRDALRTLEAAATENRKGEG